MTNKKYYASFPAHPELGFLSAQRDIAARYCDAIRSLVQEIHATCEWHKLTRLREDEPYWVVFAELATEFREAVNEVVDELADIAIDGQRQIDAIVFDHDNVSLRMAKQKAMEDVDSVWSMADRIWHLTNDGKEEGCLGFVGEALAFLRLELENARKWRDEAKQRCSEEECLLEAEFGG